MSNFAELYREYTYFFGSLPGIPLFLIPFLLRKDLRARMLGIGIFCGVVAFFEEYIFAIDYWKPTFVYQVGVFGGIESFLFGLTFGGFGVVVYETVLHKRLRKYRKAHHWIIPLMALSQALCVGIGFLLGINTIYSTTIGMIVPLVTMLLLRPDLMFVSFFSAVFCSAILIAWEIVVVSFNPSFSQQFLLFGKVPSIVGLIPITELIWGIAFGAMIGPCYEFYCGKRTINFKRITQHVTSDVRKLSRA